MWNIIEMRKLSTLHRRATSLLVVVIGYSSVMEL